MKYKSAVFAVHTDGKKPFVSDDIMALCNSASFAYDLEKMACLCFVIIPDALDTDAVRASVPFYESYEIDTEKYKSYYDNLQNQIDYLNLNINNKTVENKIFEIFGSK